MRVAISIDIGGTNTRVACINEDLKILNQESFPTDPITPEKTLNRLNDIIAKYKGNYEVVGIGVSCPGPLDLIKGSIINPPNLQGWHGLPLVEVLSAQTQLPVFLENDANLAGLAEASIGAGKGKKIVQYLTISTGLGGGLIIDKEIYLGARGFAQEIANVIVKPNGFSVGDLLPGSLESMCSGTGIVNRAQTMGLDVTHAGQVNDLAVKGHKEAIAIMDDAKDLLANAIAALYAVLDPHVVVLGGGVALKIDGFVEEVEKKVKMKMYGDLGQHVTLKQATLGDDNGIIGGAILAFNNVKR